MVVATVARCGFSDRRTRPSPRLPDRAPALSLSPRACSATPSPRRRGHHRPRKAVPCEGISESGPAARPTPALRRRGRVGSIARLERAWAHAESRGRPAIVSTAGGALAGGAAANRRTEIRQVSAAHRARRRHPARRLCGDTTSRAAPRAIAWTPRCWPHPRPVRRRVRGSGPHLARATPPRRQTP